MSQNRGHIPVLFDECMAALMPERGGIFADGTLGGAGHSLGLLEGGAERLIAIDRDEAAFQRGRDVLGPYLDRVDFVHSDFKAIRSILRDRGIQGLDGALLDLGVSSFQLDEAERGFSYGKPAPLDMRMDQSAPLTAADVVNTYSEERLRQLIFQWGEEKFASRIAAAIVRNRPVYDTTELSEIVKEAIPAACRRTGGHPAKRTFQAIRIEVNGELTGLSEAIGEFIDALNPGGRLAVISFHSLEDRAVKQAMRLAENPCTCPPEFPVCVCGKVPKGQCIPRKPILPGARELEENPRSHSAKLRVFVKSSEKEER